MGKVPCCECDKEGLKKGPWTTEEDQKLIDYIQKHGHGRWRILPKNAGLKRCRKCCRLRWTNYLRPDIKRGRFSFEEEETIIQLHCVLGNNDEALVFFKAFHGLLVFLASFLIALIGLHFQALDVSPLDTHFAIILLSVMATFVHGIAYVEIKLLPQNAEYLPILRFICLVSGIITIELLVAIIFSPFWLFMVNLCPIMILGVPRHLYQQVISASTT